MILNVEHPNVSVTGLPSAEEISEYLQRWMDREGGD